MSTETTNLPSWCRADCPHLYPMPSHWPPPQLACCWMGRDYRWQVIGLEYLDHCILAEMLGQQGQEAV